MYTDTEYEELKSKIRNVLSEIYKTYHEFKPHTLYYKEKGKKLNLFNFDDDSDSSGRLFTLLETLRPLIPNLEYALYTEFVFSRSSPSEDCVESGDYVLTVYQFIDRVSIFNLIGRNALFNESLIDIMKDPLDQLILYHDAINKKFGNVFLCSPIYQIEPYGPDPASIFHGKHGIIAYCITLSDYIAMVAMVAYKKYVYDIDELYDRALRKIHDDEELDKLLWGLWGNRVEACNVNRIFSLISDYVKEAEKLMRQYGIVRVTFPLD